MARRIGTLSILAAMAFACLASSAQSQLLSSFLLKSEVMNHDIVTLTWAPPDSASHTYAIWRGVITGSATVDTTITFTKLGTVTDTIFVDTATVAELTTYLYVVKTTNGQGQIIRSSFATVEARPPIDNVTITSLPVEQGRVGIQYSYQVAASSDNGSAILKYKLLLKPLNMSIDSMLGLITWTPAARGYREVSVLVVSSAGDKVVQNFSIAVSSGNGTVTGVVQDSVTKTPLKRVLVKLYKKDAVFHLGYDAIPDSTGTYTIKNVDPGVYYVQAYPFNPHYLPQWYQDARFRFGATSITVADSPAVFTANFSLLTDSIHLPIYRAQGKVTDTLGNPIKNAQVVWARGEFVFNGARFLSDDSTRDEGVREALDPNNPLPGFDMSLDGNSRWLYRAFTDSTGHYSIRLPKGYYLVRAKAAGFRQLSYNNVHFFLDADIFELDADTTNINFALRQNQAYYSGEILGGVSDTTTGKKIFARIFAYREWWSVQDSFPMYRNYMFDTDSLGNFDLNNLPPGRYRILALPLGQYVPSFYNESGEITLRWRLASVITLTNNDVSGVNIYVRPILRSSVGFTSINGTASSSVNVNPTGLNKIASSYPISGGYVYAVDTAGNVAGYAVTDASGSYTISGLAPGSYSMLMDCHDYTSATASNVSPSYDGSGNDVAATQNFLSTSDVTAVRSVQAGSIPSTYSLEQNFPNPFNPTTQIRFTLAQPGKISLTIYNILGQKVATVAQGNYQAGTYAVTWNGTNDHGVMAASGVYFYRLSGQAFTLTKKMLLLK